MFEKFDPPAGGLGRLRLKIEESERESQSELRALSVAASVLLVVLIGLRYAPRLGVGALGLEAPPLAAPQVEIPTGTPGVRFLWLAVPEKKS